MSGMFAYSCNANKLKTFGRQAEAKFVEKNFVTTRCLKLVGLLWRIKEELKFKHSQENFFPQLLVQQHFVSREYLAIYECNSIKCSSQSITSPNVKKLKKYIEYITRNNLIHITLKSYLNSRQGFFLLLFFI